MAKYHIKKAINNQYYWILKANNGETLIKSETYTTKDNCKNGIYSSKVSVSDSNFDRKYSIDKKYYFNQRANNYQVLGTSETYTTSYNRDHAIEVVKREAPSAPIEDLTF